VFDLDALFAHHAFAANNDQPDKPEAYAGEDDAKNKRIPERRTSGACADKLDSLGERKQPKASERQGKQTNQKHTDFAGKRQWNDPPCLRYGICLPLRLSTKYG
jgi:hypothetical protein